MNGFRRMAPVLALLVGGACDGDYGTGFGDDRDPQNLTGAYNWVLQEWTGGESFGFPMVELTWELPFDYDEEAFRVYARDSRGGSYRLIATVTSCIDGFCRYGDINVAGGESYDYYVATVDEWEGDEIGSSRTITVEVPFVSSLDLPSIASATSLDGAVYLEWDPTGAVVYMVVAQAENEEPYLIGETDGTSYLDDRAENGTRYRYFIAGVDGHGHVSGLSAAAEAHPRPDFHAEIVYALADLPSASGFRFVASENSDPIVSGTATNAHWRVETINGNLVIQPLGQTRITSGIFTTELTCGPGSEASCVDIDIAPSDSQFAGGSVPVEAGFTYVLRVIGDDNRTHYAKLRVQGDAIDTQGRRLVVFDWAYQVRAEEPRLNQATVSE